MLRYGYFCSVIADLFKSYKLVIDFIHQAVESIIVNNVNLNIFDHCLYIGNTLKTVIMAQGVVIPSEIKTYIYMSDLY